MSAQSFERGAIATARFVPMEGRQIDRTSRVHQKVACTAIITLLIDAGKQRL
ncbi:hypothetical protein ACAX43_30860 [Paraburkholderia sp. IW21]|uniref:hypothetical protein n=1 Tax=Paraburkholderia sp. IW21 TaxID=3242488 RepID=UPI003520DD6A